MKHITIDSVENFVYNGIYISPLPGFAKYKVIKLLTWTKDPGIGRFICSDKIERLIPTCCLQNEFTKQLPKQKLESNIIGGKGMIFGNQSYS